jgi:hypothetical protein
MHRLDANALTLGKGLGAGGAAQVVQHLPSKYETPSSSSSKKKLRDWTILGFWYL